MLFLKSVFKLRDAAHEKTKAPDEMGFLDHLEDLRSTIIRMVLTIFISMMLCFGFSSDFMAFLRGPVDRVWSQYESNKLPSVVDVDDWIEAKSLSAIRATLSPQARVKFESQYSAEILKLADIVPLLHAADVLPQDKQSQFITDAEPDEQLRELALALNESGAALREGKGREALKLMGAFQPGEAFMLSLSLSFFGGIIIAFPLLMYFLLRFIVPGLERNERSLVYKSMFFGFGLFIGGCAFAYFVVLPRVLTFFYSYSLDLGIENDWRIGYYISFAAKLVFVFGAIFELPVVVIPFIKLGVLHYELMKKTRAYALIACLFVALLLAPAPDPGTMLIMAMPMYALYELCIGFAYWQKRKDDARARAAGANI